MSLEEAPSYEEDESPRDKLISIEAEQMVLGCILMNNEAFHAIDGDLSADDFSEPLHQRIFTHCAKLIEKGQTADPLTLGNYFENDEAIKQIGHGYIARLAAWATSPRLIGDYAKLVRRLSSRRTLFDRCQEGMKAALKADVDDEPEQIVETFQASLDPATPRDSRSTSLTFEEASEQALNQVERAYEHGGTTGISTGFRCLDGHMGGFRPSNLIIIAGRPGMGKTALATNIAINMVKAEKRCLFFSMEMSAAELALRILSAEVNITTKLLLEGRFKDETYRRIRSARDAVKHLSLEIDERGALTIGQVASKARRVKRMRGLDAVFIDYIQLMHGTGRNMGRVDMVTEITTGLKALAKELDVPIVALSQLSREVEKRPNKRPMLSDLRDSGSIEQDADAVLFPHRPEYYLRLEGHSEETSDLLREVVGEADLSLAKWRHGPTRDFSLKFDSLTTTFRDGGGA